MTHAAEVARKLTAAGCRVGSLVNKNTGHPVKSEFQINSNIWDALILKKKKTTTVLFI